MAKLDPGTRQLIDKLIQEITYHRYRYYELDDPIISDSEFDALHEQLMEYQKKYPEINDTVGWKSPDAAIAHIHPMLSLRSTRELLVVIGLFADYDGDISCEPKVDGLSAELIYKDNQLIQATTRGDGQFGEDILANVRRINEIPHTIESEVDHVEIYGEIYITKINFIKINHQRIKDGESPYQNARNAAAGITRSDNAQHLLQYLSFYPYTVHGVTTNQTDCFKWLRTNQFNTLEDLVITIGTTDDIWGYHEHMVEERDNLDLTIDGLVFKISGFATRERLGTTLTHPNWAIAFKFEPVRVITRINDVLFQVGKSGVIAPVADLQPVFIGGSQVSRASLANQAKIEEKDIRIGDFVALEKANDVIPYVAYAIKEDRTGKEEPIIFPTCCPSCQQPITKIGPHFMCTNQRCPGQLIGKIFNAVCRYGFDIKGIGKKMVTDLVQHGLITELADVFQLDTKYDQLRQLGYGEKELYNLYRELEKARQDVPLRRFIFALSIPDVSVATSAKLATLCHQDLSQLIELCCLSNPPKLDNDSYRAEHIRSFFVDRDNQEHIKRIVNHGRVTLRQEVETKPLTRRIAITGVFDQPRSAIIEQLQQMGFKVTSDVNRKTELLLVGDKPRQGKIDKANDLNIPIKRSLAEIT